MKGDMMSLDIDLYEIDSEGEEFSVAEMNWLRNPFGLRCWIKDNTGVDIWKVVNDHSYDDSPNVDREAFLKMACEAHQAVKDLPIGYFRIQRPDPPENASSGLAFLVRDQFMTDDMQYAFHLPGKNEYWVEMEYYQDTKHSLGVPSGQSCLERYKQWTREFLEFAQLLQDETLRYYCSN